MPRKALGDRPLTAAERQARRRARLATKAAEMHATLLEVRDLIDGYVDINNNGGPNNAMRACSLISEVIGQ